MVNGEISQTESAQKPYTEKLYMYVAQARFTLAKSPAAIDLAHYVTLAFLQKIDPAIQHKTITASEVATFKDKAGTGNDNPDRRWCTGIANLVCIQSTYKLEGKIPIGIMLVNKLRDTKKVADHIDFQSELAKEHILWPIIFITGHGDISMSVQAMKAGAADFVLKPFDRQEILYTVRKVLTAARHEEGPPSGALVGALEEVHRLLDKAAAADAFKTYLERAPKAADAELVRSYLAELS